MCRASCISVRYWSIPVPDWGTLISVPDWFRHRNFYSFRCRTDWMPDCPTSRPLKKLLLVVVKEKLNARPNCRYWKVIHPSRPQTAADGVILAIWYWKIICKCRNAREKLVRYRVLPVVSCSSPASAFQHQGSVRYRWSWITVDNHGKWRKVVKRRKMVQKCGKVFKNGGK